MKLAASALALALAAFGAEALLAQTDTQDGATQTDTGTQQDPATTTDTDAQQDPAAPTDAEEQATEPAPLPPVPAEEAPAPEPAPPATTEEAPAPEAVPPAPVEETPAPQAPATTTQPPPATSAPTTTAPAQPDVTIIETPTTTTQQQQTITTTPATPPAAGTLTVEVIERDVEVTSVEAQPFGTITVTQTPAGVLLKAELTGLPPGPHGFHFHETGVCEPPFESAGGHFNPTGSKHGYLGAGGPHAGDMPNVHVPESGTLTVEVLNPYVSLQEGAANSLLDADGSALVVHAASDDYATDPSGQSGERIACGVLK